MSRAIFFVAILIVIAYFVFFSNINRRMGIGPATPGQLENRMQTEPGSSGGDSSDR